MKVRAVNALVFLTLAALMAFALLYGCASIGKKLGANSNAGAARAPADAGTTTNH